ncbi:MAG TPA: hypothetical protein PKM44_12290, partial [Turneriella sp.]|nr:hypothetical protein [Turneriella sp.]
MLDRLRTWKTTLLVFWIGLLTFQSGGWFMAWHIARQEARQIARTAAPPADRRLYRITLSLRNLEQARVDKKEIRLNGHLYDIRSLEQHGDSATVSLYHDTREEALFSALA